MTRTEAVKMLNRLLLYCECPHGDCEKCVDAIDMAIEALEQQTAECDNCKYSEETNGMNCYECVKGISDNFEALEQETVSRETYDHEFNLRKEFEMKVFELEKR